MRSDARRSGSARRDRAGAAKSKRRPAGPRRGRWPLTSPLSSPCRWCRRRPMSDSVCAGSRAPLASCGYARGPASCYRGPAAPVAGAPQTRSLAGTTVSPQEETSSAVSRAAASASAAAKPRCRSTVASVCLSSLRGTTRSSMPCASRNSLRWKPLGQPLANGLLDHPRPGEADQRMRLGDVQIPEHRERCRHSTRCRVCKHGEKWQRRR